MHKLWGLLFVLLLGCDESLGRNDCNDAGACTELGQMIPELLAVRWTEVLTANPADLVVTWRIPSACTGPCVPDIELAPAGGDAVWTLPRTGDLTAVELIDSTGARTTQSIPRPATASFSGELRLDADGQGRAVVRTQWFADPDLGPDQIAVFTPQGLAQTVEVRAGRVPLPIGTLSTPRGFLLFDRTGRSLLRMVDVFGRQLWQRTLFPNFANYVGRGALALDAGFVVAASDGPSRASAYGALFLEEDGRPRRFLVSSDSLWTSPLLLPSAGGFVLGSSSSLLQTGLAGLGTGNIDVLTYEEGRDIQTGFRLLRDCANELTMNGLAMDAAGTLYVSSLAGTPLVPRGLLCRLPRVGEPSCYQSEPNTLIGKLVVLSDGSLIAALGRVPVLTMETAGLPRRSSDLEIARIELP